MRQIVKILLVSSALVALCGCDMPEVKNHILFDAQKTFHISIPDRPWRIVEMDKDHVLITRQNSSASIGLFWTEKDHTNTPTGVVAEQLFLGFEKRKEIETTDETIDGLPAKRTIIDITTEHASLRICSYTWTKDKMVYDCVYCARKDEFDEHLNVFEETVRSFHFLHREKLEKSPTKPAKTEHPNDGRHQVHRVHDVPGAY